MTSTRMTQLATVGVIALLASQPVAAQNGLTIKGSSSLRKQARISGDSAAAIAHATVPGATIREGELEREKGRLIYSFDMKTQGKSGIDEVNIDARTGEVIGREHEDEKAEAREARADSANARNARRTAKKP